MAKNALYKSVPLLCLVITASGCHGTVPSMGSSKPKYTYLDITTTPAKALVYMKTHASIHMRKGISILPLDIEQPDDDPDWEMIGTTPIHRHEVLSESHAKLISLFACASLDMTVSIDIKIEKDGYKSILLNDVSLKTGECTQLDIDLVRTEPE